MLLEQQKTPLTFPINSVELSSRVDNYVQRTSILESDSSGILVETRTKLSQETYNLKIETLSHNDSPWAIFQRERLLKDPSYRHRQKVFNKKKNYHPILNKSVKMVSVGDIRASKLDLEASLDRLFNDVSKAKRISNFKVVYN